MSGRPAALALAATCSTVVACSLSDTADFTDGFGGTATGSAGPVATTTTPSVVPNTPGPVTVQTLNPVLTGDHPDPDVSVQMEGGGYPVFTLSATVDTGDIPYLKSYDLVHWDVAGAFFDQHVVGAPTGVSTALGDRHYCSIWAPQTTQAGDRLPRYSFTASRFDAAQDPCPPYAENGGIYLRVETGDLTEPTWEPFGAAKTCAIRDQLAHSVDVVNDDDCEGGQCNVLARLDHFFWRDPKTDRAWAAYSWYTNTPPKVPFEEDNYGEHVSLVELDREDATHVKCDAANAPIDVVNPHDQAMIAKLASSCPRCDEMLRFDVGRQDEDFVRDGRSWAVAEGASLIRRGDWVYLFVSGGIWDSAYYSVFYVAAHTPQELAIDNPDRIVGRFLIPSDDQSFGHGTALAIPGVDPPAYYFVHHHLDHGKCKAVSDCSRNVWVSPIAFEDRDDGLGDVWVVPRFPAEDRSVSITLPRAVGSVTPGGGLGGP